MTKNWKMSTVYLNDSMKRLVEKYSGRVGESRTGGTGTTLAELASRYDALMKKERHNIKNLFFDGELQFLVETICNEPFKGSDTIFDEVLYRLAKSQEGVNDTIKINLLKMIENLRPAEIMALIDWLEEIKAGGTK